MSSRGEEGTLPWHTQFQRLSMAGWLVTARNGPAVAPLIGVLAGTFVLDRPGQKKSWPWSHCSLNLLRILRLDTLRYPLASHI